MNLKAIHLATVGEKEHVLMSTGDKHLFDDIVFFQAHARDALAAALLSTIGSHGNTLDVTGMGDGDDHILVGNEVLYIEIALRRCDLGAALIAKLAGDLAHLLFNHTQNLLLMGKKVLVVGNGAAQTVQFFLDLIALKTGQATQLHLKDGGGLFGRETKALDQASRSLGIGTRRTDNRDDLVDMVESHEIALEDVRASLSLLKVKTRAAGNDINLMIDVVLQHLAQGETLGHAVDKRQVVGAKRGL